MSSRHTDYFDSRTDVPLPNRKFRRLPVGGFLKDLRLSEMGPQAAAAAAGHVPQGIGVADGVVEWWSVLAEDEPSVLPRSRPTIRCSQP